MKRALAAVGAIVIILSLAGCAKKEEPIFNYHFADKDEAIECYLSHTEYFESLGPCDLQYKTQNTEGTLEELKEFGTAQMEDFRETEKKKIEETLEEMQDEFRANGYVMPQIDEITFIKSTQKEEADSGAYTHGTEIYLGQKIINEICSDDYYEHIYGKEALWHELFHCITRSNPDFRADMYSILGFTVQDEDFVIPPSVYEKCISNPDVEHHNSYASFIIDGKEVDCFTVLIATEPFEKKGDSFFDCMETAIVPVDGTDTYYVPDDTENFWDLFGENTTYVIDPEECLADNFSFAMTLGSDYDYASPEIIDAIIDYMSAEE
jgi:hypothetical protein